MVNKMSYFYKIPFKNTRCTISMLKKNMIELCMTNTYNGYSDYTKSKLSHGDFLLMFGKTLSSDYLSQKAEAMESMRERYHFEKIMLLHFHCDIQKEELHVDMSMRNGRKKYIIILFFAVVNIHALIIRVSYVKTDSNNHQDFIN